MDIHKVFINIPQEQYLVSDGLSMSHKVVDAIKRFDPTVVFKKFPLTRHEAHDIQAGQASLHLSVKDHFFVINVEHTISGLDEMMSLIFDDVEVEA